MSTFIRFLQKLIYYLSKYWYPVALLVITLVWASAWLAPALMSMGQTAASETLYGWLAPHDHQLPQRSYFLFGESGFLQSYSLEELLIQGADPQNLRTFIGNQQLGYKTAMNHRMMAIFTGMLLGGWLWPILQAHLRGAYVALLLLPLLFDAVTHRQSELGSGFRETNTWAIYVTRGLFSESFYTGTSIGTLNWALRTGTGFLFGLGVVWLLFLLLKAKFTDIRQQLETRWRKETAG